MRSYEDTPAHAQQRRRLVNTIRDKGIKNEKVLEAIYGIPRHFFMSPDMEDKAYIDKAFPIQEGQTISQPYTVAYQSELLDLHPQHRVLEIGTGRDRKSVV